MLYNLSQTLDKERFKAKAKALLNKGVVVELTERVKRTKAQNAYLHLICGVVALETGNPVQYVKDEYFKRLCNKEIFVVTYKDNFIGKEVEVLRSSTDLEIEEMSTAIDRFKKWAADLGIYLPAQGDEEALQQIEVEMQRARVYL